MGHLRKVVPSRWRRLLGSQSIGKMAFILASMLLPGLLDAQQLAVSLSSNSPGASGVQGGTAFTRELSALTLSASGGAVFVDGITLTVGGTGDFANDLDPTTGLNVWLDDGDGQFNAGLDTMLGSTGGASPVITVSFASTLTVPDATSEEIWIVGDFLASAGASIPDTYVTSVASVGDVNVQAPASVSLGTPAPDSATLSVVIFFVSNSSPHGHKGDGFSMIGSGFTPPVSVSLGGVDLGTGTINSANTFGTGWVVPDLGPGDGDHAIVVTTALLGPITLTQQFHYDADGGGGSTGNNCSTSESRDPWLAVTFLAAMVAVMISSRISNRARG